MSEESKVDFSELDSSLTDESNENVDKLISLWTKQEESKIQQLNNSGMIKWFNIFDSLNQINSFGQNELFDPNISENEDQPDNSLNKVLDELANENLPDVFRETTAMIQNKNTGEVLHPMILSGFYKNMLVNEIKQLKTDSHYQSDQDLKEENIISREDEEILWRFACLPKPTLLSKLTQSQRNLVSSTYKLIQNSNYAYNKWLKYALPIQFVEWENEKKSISIRKEITEEKVEMKREMFKPPKSVRFRKSEYYFNWLTGIYNQNLNYRWRDYKKWKGSLKFITVNPFCLCEELKKHSPDCRVNKGDELMIYEKDEWEVQLKFNYFVEHLIIQEKYTKSKPEQLYSDLKVKAFDLSKETNAQVLAPGKEDFIRKLLKERESIQPVSYVDRIVFSKSLRKTQKALKFLRFWTNVLDKKSKRQQIILWMSDYQRDILLNSQCLKIGVITYHIPKDYEAAIVIMAFCKLRKQFLPCWFWLTTSTSWLEVYNVIFRYLMKSLKWWPSSVIIPWNKYLLQSIKQFAPNSKLIGWFRDFILKILAKCIKWYPEAIKNLEEMNFRFFSHISKSFLSKFDVNRAIELIESKIENSSQEKIYNDLKYYLRSVFFEYAEILNYRGLESVTLSHVNEFWYREIVWSGEDSDECLVNFIKWIIRIENELYYSDNINSDLHDYWEEIEKEDTVDITEVNHMQLKSVTSPKSYKNLLEFDYLEELKELIKIKEQQESNNFKNNPWNIKSILKKREDKEEIKQLLNILENEDELTKLIKGDKDIEYDEDDNYSVIETRSKKRQDKPKIFEILTIDN